MSDSTDSTAAKHCRCCRRPLVRKAGHSDQSWAIKEFCDTTCRMRYHRQFGRYLRQPRQQDDEPTEDEREEIERRKLEVRAAALGHLVFAGED